MGTTSWVIKRISTGEVVMETFDAEVVRYLNVAQYVAIPIIEYLADLNRQIKRAS